MSADSPRAKWWSLSRICGYPTRRPVCSKPRQTSLALSISCSNHHRLNNSEHKATKKQPQWPQRLPDNIQAVTGCKYHFLMQGIRLLTERSFMRLQGEDHRPTSTFTSDTGDNKASRYFSLRFRRNRFPFLSAFASKARRFSDMTRRTKCTHRP